MSRLQQKPETLIHLVALANRLEREGQALVTALCRGAVGLRKGRFTILVIAGRQFRFL